MSGYGRLYPGTTTSADGPATPVTTCGEGSHLDDMAQSDNVFVAATGVTDGELLRGVRYAADRATTHSISMRSLSGAVRLIETRHRTSTSNLIPRNGPTAPNRSLAIPKEPRAHAQWRSTDPGRR